MFKILNDFERKNLSDLENEPTQKILYESNNAEQSGKIKETLIDDDLILVEEDEQLQDAKKKRLYRTLRLIDKIHEKTLKVQRNKSSPVYVGMQVLALRVRTIKKMDRAQLFHFNLTFCPVQFIY